MSKGSWKRPVFVSHKEYSDRYDAIDWGKKKVPVRTLTEEKLEKDFDRDIKEGRAIRLTLNVGDDGTPPEEVR